MRIKTKIALIAVLLYGSLCCLREYPHEFVLADFESDDDLNRVHWQCHTLFFLSDENVTHGKKSLRIELYPSNYPGLSFKLTKNDWSKYKNLAFDVFNPQKEISITVRIDDALEYPGYEDRFNKKFAIKHGLNRINIPFNSMRTSGTERIIDPKNIFRFLIFISYPHEKSVLFIDYVHLV